MTKIHIPDLIELIKTNPAMVKHIQESVCSTLKGYAKAEIKAEAFLIRTAAKPARDQILAVVEVSGNVPAHCLVLGFAESVVARLYENLFQMKVDKVSAEVADLAAELMNIIFQTIQPELISRGYQLTASLPRLLMPEDPEKATIVPVGDAVVLPFSSEVGDLVFEIYVK